MLQTNATDSNRNSRKNPFPLERSGNLKGREISMNVCPNVSLAQRSQQTSISKYFTESKTIGTTSAELPTTTSKRLVDKYDNFYSQPINIPEKIPFPHFVSKRENEQRTEYARQMTAPPKKIQKLDEDYNLIKNDTSFKKVDSKMIHLIGHVEDALSWYYVLKNSEVHVVYNVIGKFINVLDGTHDFEKLVFIRGEKGCVLECSYFEVECKLPKLVKGQLVACFGHITGEQKFTLYNIFVLEQTTNLDIQRVIFLSQRMVLEYSGNKKSH